MAESKKIEFVASATSRKNWPKQIFPAVAIIGRSNVGKSSLINSLFSLKIARVSSRPGKTQTINFYEFKRKYYLVDLPGYGYAKVSAKKQELIRRFVEEFLLEYPRLCMLLLLVDSRHKLQKTDQIMLEFLRDKEVPYIVVLTKFDKVKKSERQKVLSYFSKVFFERPVIPFSIKTKEGHRELLREIEKWLKMC